MRAKECRREYFVAHHDPHRTGPIVVTLADHGVVVQWAGASGPPLLHLSAVNLVTISRIERAESDLEFLREEAKAAVAQIMEVRDELRAMVTAVRGGSTA